jgi:two-component system cell cycle response regulator
MTTIGVPRAPHTPQAQHAPPVLVVDDNPEACRALARFLKLIGFDASCATGGAEALARLESALPGLMILDVMMPGVDGLEVLKRVRADRRTSHLPVIMFTAADDDRTRAEAMRRGATDYWVKASLDLNSVKGRLESLLAETSALSTDGPA